MVVVHEYQIPLPLSAEEYRIAQLYMIAKFSEHHSSDNSDGDGVEVLTNEPFEEEGRRGQYTHKIYHLAKSRSSCWRFCRRRRCSWRRSRGTATRTASQNPYFTKFKLRVESAYLNDRAPQHNALNASADVVARRGVEVLDVAAEAVESYVAEEDPARFTSKKTGRGPFTPGWQERCSPCMVAYKLVTVDAPYWGFGPQLEKYIARVLQRKLNIEANRKAICWMDEWHGMTLEGVRRMEAEAFHRINQDRKQKYGAQTENGAHKEGSSHLAHGTRVQPAASGV
ncbi:hypothetical protein CLOP_g2200 [Closterium sp. NIES-67]|nr:hypothetical protein CLOP_g2200 [Closterium sp. NIES-67]